MGIRIRNRIRIRMFLGLPDPHPHHKYGSGSSSGSKSFHHQAKIVKKPWLLLFCDFFMTFNQCSRSASAGSVCFRASRIRIRIPNTVRRMRCWAQGKTNSMIKWAAHVIRKSARLGTGTEQLFVTRFQPKGLSKSRRCPFFLIPTTLYSRLDIDFRSGMYPTIGI